MEFKGKMRDLNLSTDIRKNHHMGEYSSIIMKRIGCFSQSTFFFTSVLVRKAYRPYQNLNKIYCYAKLTCVYCLFPFLSSSDFSSLSFCCKF